ncbi:MAG TPA: flagellar export chaperone FliS [Bacteroidales bacterium]|nr:flagellar export chaperone FliS [Bacteroidales bacterium]
MYCNGVQSYRKTNITTSDPVRLIIMCYEGAIDSLKLAKEKIKEKDYEKKAKAIIKAQDIIEELMSSLNFEKGGEIADNLESLYNYMLRRILQGDLNKDVGAIDEVIGIFSDLLSAWQEVALKPESQVQPERDILYQEKRAAGSGYISV